MAITKEEIQNIISQAISQTINELKMSFVHRDDCYRIGEDRNKNIISNVSNQLEVISTKLDNQKEESDRQIESLNQNLSLIYDLKEESIKKDGAIEVQIAELKTGLTNSNKEIEETKEAIKSLKKTIKYVITTVIAIIGVAVSVILALVK